MASTLVVLEDGTLVEVTVPQYDVVEISATSAAAIDKSLEMMEQFLVKTCKPIATAVRAACREAGSQQAEIEFGVGMEIEGNFYIAKLAGTANMTIRMTIDVTPTANVTPTAGG